MEGNKMKTRLQMGKEKVLEIVIPIGIWVLWTIFIGTMAYAVTLISNTRQKKECDYRVEMSKWWRLIETTGSEKYLIIIKKGEPV
jgi:hypothetical protein